MALLCIQSALFAAIVNAGSAGSSQIEPAWRWRAAAELLWLEIEPAPEALRAVALDATGTATLLNLRSGAVDGTRRLDPSARVAGWNATQLFVFDRRSISALRFDRAESQPAGPLDWSIGAPAAPQPDVDADPEFTARLIGAAIARDLVIALGSDGGLSAYEAHDGAMRWRLSLDSGAQAQLWPPALDPEAESDQWWGAVSWRSGGVSRAVIWYSAGAARPTLEPFELGAESPVWQGLARNDWVSVLRDQIVTKAPSSRVHHVPLPGGVSPTTARIVMRDPPPWRRRSAPPPLEGGAALFLASEAGDVLAIEAFSGAVCWSVSPTDEPRLGPIERVVAAGDDPLLLSAIGWRRLRYRDGAVVHAAAGEGRLVRAAGTAEETLGVFAGPRAAGGVELNAVVQACQLERPAKRLRLSGAFRAPRVLHLRPFVIVTDGADVAAFELPR